MKRKKDSSKPEVKKKNLREVVEVCPQCFSILKRTPQIFDFNQNFHCSNEDCGWTGSFAIEVNINDYEKFMKDRELKNQSQDTDDGT
ncbi:MAG: hypothetical protein ACTSQE_01015 [Candidatus Heimdallarchaeaceae archaeon]